MPWPRSVAPSCLALLLACKAPPAERPPEPIEQAAYTLVVHGGAGALSDQPERRAARASALAESLREGCAALDGGASSLDVVEQVVGALEEHPLFNAGRGAVFTAEGTHELDASIMDGSDLSAGGVAGVRTVRHPVRLARVVMEQTRHVLLAGEGAEKLAVEHSMEPVSNDFFSTPARRAQLEEVLAERAEGEPGTVGAVALDREGHLAAATSTGGLTAKRWGRVGDSPIIGAGTYADDRTCAVSGTGIGEEFIRHGVAHAISQRMALRGDSAQTAANEVIGEVLEPGTGGVIVVSRRGEPMFAYSTPAMARGACGALVDLQVWLEEEPVDL